MHIQRNPHNYASRHHNIARTTTKYTLQDKHQGQTFFE